MKRLLCLLLLAASAAFTASAGPSAREKEILANAKPGEPVTLPDRKSDVVIKLPFPVSSPTSGDSRLLRRSPKKANMAKSSSRVLKVQGFWFGQPEDKGKRRVIIDLSHQVVQVWAGDNLVGQSPVSTGREGHETPAGNYSIQEKDADHHSNQFGSWIDAAGKYKGDANAGDKAPAGLIYAPAPMPFFLRITDGGIGMHSGYVTGAPASHGCIRLPYNMAENFFEYLSEGTPVEIRD